MYCYRRVASILTFNSDYSAKHFFSNCLRQCEKNNFLRENCCTQTTRNKVVGHKKRCSIGTLYCTRCPNFSTKTQKDLNCHIAKKHSAPKHDINFRCNLCYQKLPGLYASRRHRITQHGMQIGSRTKDVDVEHTVGCVEDHRLKEELRSCQHFVVNSEIEKARYNVFNYAVENL